MSAFRSIRNSPSSLVTSLRYPTRAPVVFEIEANDACLLDDALADDHNDGIESCPFEIVLADMDAIGLD